MLDESHRIERTFPFGIGCNQGEAAKISGIRGSFGRYGQQLDRNEVTDRSNSHIDAANHFNDLCGLDDLVFDSGRCDEQINAHSIAIDQPRDCESTNRFLLHQCIGAETNSGKRMDDRLNLGIVSDCDSQVDIEGEPRVTVGRHSKPTRKTTGNPLTFELIEHRRGGCQKTHSLVTLPGKSNGRSRIH